MINTIRVLFALLMLLPLQTGYTLPLGGIDSYIGKAGDVFISEKEFVQRFEMLPALYRHRKPQLEGAKLELLYSMIAEKLLAQDALARGFDRDTIVQNAFAEVRKLLARDELYRQEVSNKINITPREIKNGVAQAQMQMLVEFIFSGREEDAKFIRDRIKNGSDFDRMQIDSSMGALRDTATVIWGDADPDIQAAAYKLKQGEISPVVSAGEGYYILKRLKVYTNGFYASMQPNVLQERITTKIRERKEQIRTGEFVNDILKNKIGRSRPAPFKILAMSMMDVFRNHARDSLITLTPEIVLELKSHVGRALGDTLVEIENDRLSVEDVVEKLLSRRLTVPSAMIRTTPDRLNAEIKLMVQQELLGQEALRRGLDNVPSVRQQLEMWHNAYLADMMREYVRNHVRVSDAEVYAYLKSKDPTASVPFVQIRELRTGTINQMSEALSDLEKGISFEKVIDKWSNDSIVKANHGVSDFFPITDRLPVGEIASLMEIGQRYGPVQVPQGVLYFELLARRPAAGSQTDTSLEARRKSGKGELLRMKQKRMLDLYLAQLGQERGFTVYDDRLGRIEVSPVPMMTFRMLGFGGRMFAVPFVQKELDWLDVDPPREKILP